MDFDINTFRVFGSLLCHDITCCCAIPSSFLHSPRALAPNKALSYLISSNCSLPRRASSPIETPHVTEQQKIPLNSKLSELAPPLSFSNVAEPIGWHKTFFHFHFQLLAYRTFIVTNKRPPPVLSYYNNHDLPHRCTRYPPCSASGKHRR